MKDEKERCRIFNEIIDELRESECGDLDAYVQVQALKIGVELPNPLSERCKVVLRDGVTDEVCAETLRARTYAACRAWQLLFNKEESSWSVALSRAWEELHRECGK